MQLMRNQIETTRVRDQRGKFRKGDKREKLPERIGGSLEREMQKKIRQAVQELLRGGSGTRGTHSLADRGNHHSALKRKMITTEAE